MQQADVCKYIYIRKYVHKCEYSLVQILSVKFSDIIKVRDTICGKQF